MRFEPLIPVVALRQTQSEEFVQHLLGTLVACGCGSFVPARMMYVRLIGAGHKSAPRCPACHLVRELPMMFRGKEPSNT